MPETNSQLNPQPKKIVTRFAPSPTGFMHVGGARTALFAWAFARKQGAGSNGTGVGTGTFILRIEDTDKAREVEGSIDHIIKSLRWLGLDWNEGPDIGGPNAPYIQSSRLDTYKKYAEKLIDKGLAYADPYTPEDLEGFRKKAEEEKRPFLYRDHRPADISALPRWDGTRALRFKVPEVKSYAWHDLVRGDLSAGPEALDDFILIKSDGYPTYNFAHIIDDLYMGATHIFRADEFIASMPKFLSLYDALEIKWPDFVTLPPILGADGNKKLGKRDGAKDILDYKAEGYLPDAMMNFLAFIGWNPGDEREVFTPAEFIEAFDIAGIQKAGGRFNEEKLKWFNKEHLKKLDDAKFTELALDFITPELKSSSNFNEIFAKIVPELRERISYFAEMKEMESSGDLDFYFKQPSYGKELLLCPEKQRKGKDISFGGLAAILSHVRDIIEKAEASPANAPSPKDLPSAASASKTEDLTAEYAKELIWPYAELEGRGIVLWSLRVALSGKERSPDPFSLCQILGKNETISRLDVAIQKLKA